MALATLLLAGCSSSSDLADRSESGDGAAQAPEDAQAPEGAEQEGSEGGGDGSVNADVEIDERQLIHTAEMTVRVEDVDEATELAKELTVESEGYVSAEEAYTPTGGPATSTLTLRLPNDGYEGALSDLAELGDRSSLERSVEDVTDEVTDTESRIASSEAALETLRGYLDQAENVEELLEVESHIQERQEELEAFQARLEALEDQTTYSTITLSLRSLHAPEEDIDDDESLGFLGGLENGARALLSLGQGLLTVVGWLLPFAVAIAVLGLGPWLWWRSRRPERTKPRASRLRRLVRRGSSSAPATPERGQEGQEPDGDSVPPVSEGSEHGEGRGDDR